MKALVLFMAPGLRSDRYLDRFDLLALYAWFLLENKWWTIQQRIQNSLKYMQLWKFIRGKTQL